MCVFPVCMSVHHIHDTCKETRREHWILWNILKPVNILKVSESNQSFFFSCIDRDKTTLTIPNEKRTWEKDSNYHNLLVYQKI